MSQVPPPRPKTRAPGTWTHDDFNNHCAGLLDYAARSLRRSQESAQPQAQQKNHLDKKKELQEVTRNQRSSRRLQVLAKRQNPAASAVKANTCEKRSQALSTPNGSRLSSRMERLKVLSKKKASSLNLEPKTSSLRPSSLRAVKQDTTNPFDVALSTSDTASR